MNMEVFHLTKKQLRRATLEHRFIAVRFPDGELMGINCRVADILVFKHGKVIDDKPTKFVGYKPISFQEYIRIKGPYFS